ncbi:MAG: ABC transporter substrate-binding protein [Actinomycetota bacterium]
MRHPRRPSRAIAAALSAAFIVAACGDDADPVADTANDGTVTTTSDDTGAVGNEADEPTEGTTVEQAPTETTPTNETPVATATSEAGVLDDQVLVDMTDSVFDFATFGIVPAGNIYGSAFAPVVFDQIENVDQAVVDAILATPDITAGAELNREALAAAEPDLILLSPTFEAVYNTSQDELEQIAPVQMIDEEVSWQERTRLVAELAGREDEAEERIEAIDDKLNELEQRVAEADLTGTTVSILRVLGDDVWAFTQQSTAAMFAERIGFVLPPAQQQNQPEASPFQDYVALIPLSAEEFGDHAGDFVIVAVNAPVDDPSTAFTSPVVAELIPALGQGAAIDVPWFLWALNSIVGVEQMVQDLEAVVDELTS